MLKEVKDIALGTRMAGGVINRRQLISIATEVLRANNPNLLKEYGGDLVLTDKWARGVLEKLTWSKRKYNDCRYLRSFKMEKILPMVKYHPHYRI